MPVAHQIVSAPEPRVRSGSAPATLSLRVWLRRRALDARLAAGEDPALAPQLAVRARQLCELKTRRPLGRAIVAILERSQRRGPTLSSAVPPARRSIEEARPALAQLAIALRSPEPVFAEGVAQVLELLRDGAGPLYVDAGDPSALYFAARRALLALRPCSPCPVELVEHGEWSEHRG